ncbi:hypothetical protein [Marinobacter adhaerens]|uniref:hypothetical protein n=1 Tax=Marinobacter adhaerens TaxID=1033846 RepID=UPI001C5681D1|nr:hypothetical protein [Marinobacter adhaerens]MBW3225621.1 hypothetical protein [Marinobacter adhaerens]
MNAILKKSVNRLLRSIGLEIRSVERNDDVPRVFESPKEALLFQQGGKPSLFYCPIEKVTHVTGLGLSKSDWNPFVETIAQFESDNRLKYYESPLKHFYNKCQPKNAGEAVFGFNQLPREFKALPPYMIFLLPWLSLTEEEVTQDTLWWNQKDNAEHGRPDLSYPKDGWAFFGPVSEAKGELEFQRTISLHQSIKLNGYDSSKGGIGVTLLKRGHDFRYLLGGGGYHRAISLKAADYESMIARFHRLSIVDVEDVELWPNVRNGLWTTSQALAYVDHLFDFHSKNWAIDNGLSEKSY